MVAIKPETVGKVVAVLSVIAVVAIIITLIVNRVQHPDPATEKKS